jgi:hypothetical protein
MTDGDREHTSHFRREFTHAHTHTQTHPHFTETHPPPTLTDRPTDRQAQLPAAANDDH